MRVSFTVPGEPVSQPRQRHRIIPGQKFAHNYTPAKAPVNAFKAMVRLVASQAYTGPLIDEPVRIHCSFVFSRPKSHYRTGAHSNELKANAPTWHASRPDRDNCDKSVLDALKGVVLADDKCACAGELIKRYTRADEQPYTKIEIETISEGEPE